jgi:hypothetical protein
MLYGKRQTEKLLEEHAMKTQRANLGCGVLMGIEEFLSQWCRAQIEKMSTKRGV